MVRQFESVRMLNIPFSAAALDSRLRGNGPADRGLTHLMGCLAHIVSAMPSGKPIWLNLFVPSEQALDTNGISETAH